MITRLWIVLICLGLTVSSNSTAVDAPLQQPDGAIDSRPDEVLMAVAQKELLIGSWDGIDHASESTYGTLTVTKTHISWRGCRTRYSIVMKSVGDTYPDRHSFLRDVKDKRYVTLKLKLEPKQCLLTEQAYLQFSFSTDFPRYAAVIEYDDSSKPLGWISFGKR